MIHLTKERKIILIAGGILLLAGLMYRLAPDVKALTVSREEIVLKENRIQRYRQAVQRRQALESRLMELNRVMAGMENRLIKGKTDSLGQVDLQNIVNDIANRAGIRIDSMRVIKTLDMDEGNFIAVNVDFSGKAPISALFDLIYGIEASERMLAIGALSIRTPTTQTRAETLEFTLTVGGLMKKPDESGQDG